MLRISLQVAAAMLYLGENNIVHRDLAARNCLTARAPDGCWNTKVSDFGISRYMSTKTPSGERIYKSRRRTPLPMKWTAVEGLEIGQFSQKSDVWSFGVLLWELVTFGLAPYPDMSNSEVKRFVKGGNRLSRPPECSDDMYHLMMGCWRRLATR